MKKMIVLLIMLPTLAFSQENLKKSAEDFITNYFKMFEDKKWDDILSSYSEDGQLLRPNHTITSLPVAMKSALDRNKTDLTSDKIQVKWISADVMGPSSAMVTASYRETTDRSGNISVLDKMDVYLLAHKEGSWKIKKIIPQNNTPLIYSENIDKKFQAGSIGPLPKFTGALNQIGSVFMYELEYFKKSGTTPEELGKMMGARFAKTWDQSVGFAGLVSGYVWGLQLNSSYVEVLDRNDNILKARFIPPAITEKWDATKEDLRIMWQAMWNELADYMGGKCSLEQDGKYWVLMLSKK